MQSNTIGGGGGGGGGVRVRRRIHKKSAKLCRDRRERLSMALLCVEDAAKKRTLQAECRHALMTTPYHRNCAQRNSLHS